MLNIRLTTHIGDDGILNVQMPSDVRNTELDVLVVFQATTSPGQDRVAKDREWPSGFFEKTWGSCADDLIIIDEEGVSTELDDPPEDLFANQSI
ncbi:hypothetical protein AY600_01130 [Phormidium willei BDU 130791]|nr:hypothetical protein AY600_01130 [Phormidium willei BDU 130791]